MSTTTGDWYVSRGGERFGPVSFQDLMDAARAGRLEPRTDLVFGDGLSTWTPAGEVDGVFEKKERVVDPDAVAGGHAPPSDALADSGSYDFGDQPTKLQLPGATRIGYVLGTTVLPAIVFAGLAFLVPQMIAMIPEQHQQYAPYLGLVVMILPVLVAILVTVKRFQNLAMSGWWLLGLMVPFLNYWLQYRLFACPPGYAFTKKLDGIGKFLAVLYWLLVIASFAVPVLFLTGALAQFASSEDLKAWLEQARSQLPEVPAAK